MKKIFNLNATTDIHIMVDNNVWTDKECSIIIEVSCHGWTKEIKRYTERYEQTPDDIITMIENTQKNIHGERVKNNPVDTFTYKTMNGIDVFIADSYISGKHGVLDAEHRILFSTSNPDGIEESLHRIKVW